MEGRWKPLWFFLAGLAYGIIQAGSTLAIAAHHRPAAILFCTFSWLLAPISVSFVNEKTMRRKYLLVWCGALGEAITMFWMMTYFLRGE